MNLSYLKDENNGLKAEKYTMGIKENIKYIIQTNISSAFNIIISVIRSKLIAMFIGTNGFGIISQFTNLSNISSFIIDIGTSTGAIVEISNARKINDAERIEKIRATYFIIQVWGSLIISIFIYLFSDYLNFLLFGQKDYSHYVKLFSLFTITIGLSNAYSYFLNADKLIKALMYKSVITSLINSGLTVICIYFYNLDGIVYGLITNGLINVTTGIYFCHRYHIPTYFIQFLKNKFDRSIFKNLLSYSSIILVTSLSIQFSSVVMQRVIIQEGGLHDAGLFQASSNITQQYVLVFISTLGIYLLPHLAEKNDQQNAFKECNNSLRTILLLAVPFLFGMFIFSDLLIRLLYTADFIPAAELLSITVIGALFLICNKVIGTLIVAQKNISAWLIGDLLFAILMPLLTFLLYGHYGLKAASFAYVTTNISLFMFYLFFLKNKIEFKITKINCILIATAVICFISLFLAEKKINTLTLKLILLGVSTCIFLSVNISKAEFIKIKKTISSYLHGIR